ncbi:rRNA maturation RNase YbeY [candidate division WOR-1 bacterium RIFOXYB2_FULL_48_7]|uniref:Endoribonuclease YbeY n=1 Tax=candidate division WOR-1 bacterium RIFOXYB2_FULL_48_7 TaxID=1802583 RepID=A0A1F4TRN6_UNCSA|nr:MAG: rRNA maturation RNase YbeY [candidate division WOR-1 bacterium RIFOXYB2_FULL_48_7]
MYKRLIRQIIKGEGRRGKIDLTFVDERTIHGLNEKFRQKDRPTDVLAFPMEESGFLGDVIISKTVAAENAKRFGVSKLNELKRLVIHGALHVLGYDHGRKMRHAEEIYQKF